MQIFDKGTIEGFAQSVDEKMIDENFSRLSFVVQKTMDDIRKNNAYINENFEIIPINEFMSGAVTPRSNLDILLVLNSPQLEFNTVKFIKNKFKSIWLKIKDIWKYRKRKSKKKKKKNKESYNEEIDFDKNLYSMISFQKDFVNHISNYLSSSSIVILSRGVIVIKGEDFAFKIRIFPVINKFGSYNYYLSDKIKFFNIDFKERNENLEYLISEFDEKYINFVRIFTNIYYSIYNKTPNAIFIESLVANFPKEIYELENTYDMFLFALNFLNNTRLSNIRSITNFAMPIYKDDLCEMNIAELKKFIDDMVKYTKMPV